MRSESEKPVDRQHGIVDRPSRHRRGAKQHQWVAELARVDPQHAALARPTNNQPRIRRPVVLDATKGRYRSSRSSEKRPQSATINRSRPRGDAYPHSPQHDERGQAVPATGGVGSCSKERTQSRPIERPHQTAYAYPVVHTHGVRGHGPRGTRGLLRPARASPARSTRLAHRLPTPARPDPSDGLPGPGHSE